MATTQPIKSTNDLDKVRDVLTSTRDRALFEMGVGTAFRGSDILSLKVGDVDGLKVGDDLVIREKKTQHRNKRARRVKVNALVVEALQAQVAERLEAGAGRDDWLFVSRSNFKSDKASALSTVSLTRLWKDWCEQAGIEGRYGSHTGRKSFGYLSRVEDGVSIEILQKAYGHSSPQVTQAYICVLPEEVEALYMRPRTNRG